MLNELSEYLLLISFIEATSFIYFLGKLNLRCSDNQYSGSIIIKLFPFLICLTNFLVVGFLTVLFLQNDYSNTYILNNSNTNLQWYYKITAVWSSHEGSLLLWSFIQAIWIFLYSLNYNQNKYREFYISLMILSFIYAWFIVFIFFTSNPFERNLLVFPSDGHSLNPLLQDIGLILHPPILYLGYIGFSVPFAIFLSCLMTKTINLKFLTLARNYSLYSWSFLTFGITLGSWWAYYELGWGGWWFWDPVENASLMPWISGLALIHALSLCKEKPNYINWSIFLGIMTFSLSLFGTFLVRSGILVSVHSFASNAERGLFILSLIALIIGFALILFSFRKIELKNNDEVIQSNEILLLINNILLITGLIIVFMGTMLPLFHEEMGFGAISVGFPFFNLMFFILIIPFSIILGFMPIIKYSKNKFKKNIRIFVVSIISSSIISGILVSFQNDFAIKFIVIIFCSILIIQNHLVFFQLKRNDFNSIIKNFSMFIAHIGFGIFLLGVAFVSQFQMEKVLQINLNQTVSFDDISLTLRDIQIEENKNYKAEIATFEMILPNNKKIILNPEKRLYKNNGIVTTETAIYSELFKDIYIALGNKKGTSFSIRFAIKPMVRWVWGGGILMSLGFLSLIFRANKNKKISKKNILLEC